MAQYIKKFQEGGSPKLIKTLTNLYSATDVLDVALSEDSKKDFLKRYGFKKNELEAALNAYDYVLQAINTYGDDNISSFRLLENLEWEGKGLSRDPYVSKAIGYIKYQIMDKMDPYKAPEVEKKEKEKFRPSQLFGDYFSYSLTGNDKLTLSFLEDWMSRDDIDISTGIRSNRNRLSQLSTILEGYRDSLQNSSEDYDWGIYKDKESYIQKINDAINSLLSLNNSEYDKDLQKTLREIFDNLGMADKRVLFDTSKPTTLQRKIEDIDADEYNNVAYNKFLQDHPEYLLLDEQERRDLFNSRTDQQLQSLRDEISSHEALTKWDTAKQNIFNSNFQEQVFFTLPKFEPVASKDIKPLKNLSRNIYHLLTFIPGNGKNALTHQNSRNKYLRDLRRFIDIQLIDFEHKLNTDFIELGNNEYLLKKTFNPDNGIITKYNLKTGLLSTYRINVDDEIYKDLLEEMKKTFYKKNNYKYNVPKKSIGGILTEIRKFQNSGLIDYNNEILDKFKSEEQKKKEKDILQSLRLTTTTFPIIHAAGLGSLRNLSNLISGQQELDWDFSDFTRAGGAVADLISAIISYKQPQWGLGIGFAGTIANSVADFTDKSVSTGEALRNTGTNLFIDMASLIPVLGKKYRKLSILQAGKLVRPVATFMLASSVPAIKRGAESLIKFIDTGLMTKDDFVSIINGLTVATNSSLWFASRRNTNKIAPKKKQINVNVKDNVGHTGVIEDIPESVVKEIKSKMSVDDQNAALRNWAQQNPDKVNGYDATSLLLSELFIPSKWITSSWKKFEIFEQSPFKNLSLRLWKPSDNLVFIENWKKDDGLGALAYKAAREGNLTKELLQDAEKFDKLTNNTKLKVKDKLKKINNDALKNNKNFALKVSTPSGVSRGYLVRKDGSYAIEVSQNLPENAVTSATEEEIKRIELFINEELNNLRVRGLHTGDIERSWKGLVKKLQGSKNSSNTKISNTDELWTGGTNDVYKLGGKLQIMKSLRNFPTDNSSSSNELSSLKQGGIIKGAGGLVIPEWYNNRYGLKHLNGEDILKPRNLKANTNLLIAHNLYDPLKPVNGGDYVWTLLDVFNRNLAYTTRQDAVTSDINTYAESDFKDADLNTFVNEYNKSAQKIRDFWKYGKLNPAETTTYMANDINNDYASHNRLFRKMFANRSTTNQTDDNKDYIIGYLDNLENQMGTNTWKRRMDLYEKEFGDLSTTDKLKRVHYVKGKGWVYKLANGDIGIVSNEDILALGLQSDGTITTPPTTTSDVASDSTNTEAQTGTQLQQDSGQQETGEFSSSNDAEISQDEKKGKAQKTLKTIQGFLQDFKPDILATGRLAWDLYNNRRMYNVMRGLRAPLKGQIVEYSPLRNGFDIELAANELANEAMAKAGVPKTSDASLNLAIALENQLKSAGIIREGLLRSNEILRRSEDAQRALNNKVYEYNRGVADFNTASLTELSNQWRKMKAGLYNANAQSWDKYLMGLELRAREAVDERKTLLDDYDKYVVATQASRDPDVIDAYNKYKNLLSDTAKQSQPGYASELYNARYLYEAALQKAKENLYLQYYTNRGVRVHDVSSSKKGGTIDDTQVKKRKSDNDRLAKQIIAELRNNSRALENLSRAQLLSIKKMLS